MAEHGERLTFTLEARNDLAAVHPEANHLERDVALQRLLLLREVHDPHATGTDLADDLVRTDLLGDVILCQLRHERARRVAQGFELLVVGLVQRQQAIQLAPQLGTRGCDLVQVMSAFFALALPGLVEQPAESLEVFRLHHQEAYERIATTYTLERRSF